MLKTLLQPYTTHKDTSLARHAIGFLKRLQEVDTECEHIYNYIGNTDTLSDKCTKCKQER